MARNTQTRRDLDRQRGTIGDTAQLPSMVDAPYPELTFTGQPAVRSQRFLDRLRVSPALHITDQALSSGTNFLATIAVARNGTPEEFGVFSLILLIFFLTVGYNRAVPHAIAMTLDWDNERERNAYFFLPALVLGGTCALVFAPVFAILDPSFALVAALLLPLLLQDAVRMHGFAIQKPFLAIRSDLAWFAVQLVGLGFATSAGGAATVWAAGSVCGVLVTRSWLHLSWKRRPIKESVVTRDARIRDTRRIRNFVTSARPAVPNPEWRGRSVGCGRHTRSHRAPRASTHSPHHVGTTDSAKGRPPRRAALIGADADCDAGLRADYPPASRQIRASASGRHMACCRASHPAHYRRSPRVQCSFWAGHHNPEDGPIPVVGKGTVNSVASLCWLLTRGCVSRRPKRLHLWDGGGLRSRGSGLVAGASPSIKQRGSSWPEDCQSASLMREVVSTMHVARLPKF